MPGRPAPRGARPSTLAVIALYALIMSAGAFLHHDFACHQNSRTHCPSCQLTQHAQKTEAGGAPLDAPRCLVGRIELRSDFSAELPAVSSISDRAPPAGV
jgi:hypothetical protein